MTDFVAADCAIRQLHARFVDAVWRKDAQAFGECFAEHGEWKIAGLHFSGRAEIADSFARLLGACERVLVMPGPAVLDIGDGEATGRVPMIENAKLADGSSAMTIGIYFDRYVEEGGRWLFKARHWSLHYRGPSDLSAPFVDSPDYGPPPGMPGPDEPTLTRRTQPL